MPQTEETSSATPAAVPLRQQDQDEIRSLYDKIRSRRAKLVGPDGEAKSLPSSLYSFLLLLLADLNEGKSVSILQGKAELTTVQASHLLGVSRQFLINLLSEDKIPYHRVGTHRRMYAKDVLLFKAKRDNERKKALEDLIESELSEGIFDGMPDDQPS